MSAFDYWTLNHFASGLVIGLLLSLRYSLRSVALAGGVFVLLIAWEVFEYVGYKESWTWVEPWFNEESFANRTADVLIGALGYVIAIMIDISFCKRKHSNLFGRAQLANIDDKNGTKRHRKRYTADVKRLNFADDQML